MSEIASTSSNVDECSERIPRDNASMTTRRDRQY